MRPLTPPDLLSLLRCSSRDHTPSAGKQIHCHLVKSGHQRSPPLPAALLDMYGKCNLLSDAHNLFDETPQPDPFLCSVLLVAESHSDCPARALNLFRRFTAADGVRPDNYIFATVAKACARSSYVKLGRQAHAQFLVSPFSDDDVVKSALVDMYAKCRAPDDARNVFYTVARKNRVCWTAIVSGFASNGRSSEAIDLFQSMPEEKGLFTWTALISGLARSGDNFGAVNLFIDMRRGGIVIDDSFVLSSAVGAASDMATLELGKQLHCVVVVLGYESSQIGGNALVDMYAKCSDIFSARAMFERISERDIVSWTTMVVGEAQHGRVEESLELFNRMVVAGVKPNEVTFVGLIYACSHAGLVRKGREFFDLMIQEYGIRPSLQHYTCLLDLLSRSGYLLDAENVIKTMPFEPDEATWAALLSACKKHGDIQMSIRVADHLSSLRLQYPSTYILLSNIYAYVQKWDRVADMRKLMADMEIKIEPGYSWIEMGKESCLFWAGEVAHDKRNAILGLLEELGKEMRRRGYAPDTSSVMHDLEEHEKEQQLSLHSERLAVAYGLLKSVPGATIRVLKNLRVCEDCHTVMKLISSISGRNIVVRDANRFHHFEDGECSCGDFW